MRVDFDAPITGTFLAPVARAYDTASGWAGRVGALFGAGIQAVWNDFFLTGLAILLLSHVYDWLYGRKVARVRKEFDQDKSALGLYSKLASMAIVLLVRLLEMWLANGAVIQTKGIIAAGITALLIIEDIHSIEAKRISTGAGPIPFLSRGLRLIEEIVEKWMPEKREG